MQIKNGNLFTQNNFFEPHDLILAGDRITRIAPSGLDTKEEEVLDATGCYVVPGMVDIHIHGSAGCDFCDGTVESVDTIAAFLARRGVTSFLGTSMALPEKDLAGVFKTAAPLVNADRGGAVLRGINMEGPFFSKAKKGAQAEKNIIDPDIDMFDRLYEASGGAVRLVDVAPELPGATEFIAHACRRCWVSLAHTAANYEQSKAGFFAGADHVTHLFNAMPPFNHREPGLVGASVERADYVELISDGIHLHPSVVRAAFRLFGDERVCLISDAMRAAGMPNGAYTLGGQEVHVKEGKATLANGTIAGSATPLSECMKRAVSFGVPLETALRAATANPAKSVGLYEEIGSLSEGKRADVVLLDKGLNIKAVVIGGKRIV